jgi:hypothetical protein
VFDLGLIKEANSEFPGRLNFIFEIRIIQIINRANLD